ncbi:hypothetical protein BV210_05110 [Halorientalis sp. IM1011]|uniref:hypothetical protein n=1 Tax=Halorientalis sp. IM1011 TaxID=1932360 RepID=UPI00097CCA8D|nr:hypothetical protein [Halorientalis sp. IM1011]AQL42128.1 hypothetical protein BV210_05110 [Halorientalis sp. IM1011]
MTHDRSADHDPSKRIPKSLNNDTKLYGRYTLQDVAVALFPGVLVILTTQVILPPSLSVWGYGVQTLTLPIAGIAILIGGIFVTLTPKYTDSLGWIENLVQFYRSARNLEHEDAASYTQVECIHPDRGAIERTDGALVGLVQVDPPNMALATDAEWAKRADSFQDFLNTVVEFPIQIHSTTREFPAEEYLSHYESRLCDQDVKENPQLQALIENYVAWYERDLEQRQMTIRDHYVVVAVRPSEVQFEQESIAQQLTGIPVIGTFVRVWLAPGRDQEREAMFEALETRRRQIEGGLREIEGCSARQVPVTDAVELLASFWAGEAVAYGTTDDVVAHQPLLGGGTDV